MGKPRIYLDTSVFGGYFDTEFESWSKKLFREIEAGNKIAVVSELVLKELQKAPDAVRKLMSEVSKEMVAVTKESENLAQKYIDAEALSKKYRTDAEHIAVAVVHNVDILASWNFQHIVKLWRIQMFNGINLMNGYKAIEIRSPREIVDE